MALSYAPDGRAYEIPDLTRQAEQFAEIRERAELHRVSGGKVVVVQGLGFVGSAVAAVIACARDARKQPKFFVIGVDLASPESYWKLAKIDAGEVPIPSPDDELTDLIAIAVRQQQNLCVTAVEEAYALADTIVVDLPLDVSDRLRADPTAVDIIIAPFEQALQTIGAHMRPNALVLVETTVPIGFCERVVSPLLRRSRSMRGIDTPLLLAHAYERVMPGPRYVDSIKRFRRTFSGIDTSSAAAAREFLEAYIDVDSFPLIQLADTTASELAKVLENSYRAANIAFIHEWTLLAEKVGVNLFEIVESIRVRKGTHDNMRFPGFGVGGYCLTKDSLLAQWSATTLFETGIELSVTLEALRINTRMPLHTLDLAGALSGGSISGVPLAIAGISYLPEVADTRNSPTEILIDEALRLNALPTVTDPYVSSWKERPNVPIAEAYEAAFAGARGIIFAVPHRAYRSLTATEIIEAAPDLHFVIDGFDIITDGTAAALHAAGVRVAGVGKGHWFARGYDR